MPFSSCSPGSGPPHTLDHPSSPIPIPAGPPRPPAPGRPLQYSLVGSASDPVAGGRCYLPTLVLKPSAGPRAPGPWAQVPVARLSALLCAWMGSGGSVRSALLLSALPTARPPSHTRRRGRSGGPAAAQGRGRGRGSGKGRGCTDSQAADERSPCGVFVFVVASSTGNLAGSGHQCGQFLAFTVQKGKLRSGRHLNTPALLGPTGHPWAGGSWGSWRHRYIYKHPPALPLFSSSFYLPQRTALDLVPSTVTALATSSLLASEAALCF